MPAAAFSVPIVEDLLKKADLAKRGDHDVFAYENASIRIARLCPYDPSEEGIAFVISDTFASLFPEAKVNEHCESVRGLARSILSKAASY